MCSAVEVPNLLCVLTKELAFLSRFEAFLKRMRLHYSDYVPTGDEMKYERPHYELPPMKRDKKPPEPYYDKR